MNQNMIINQASETLKKAQKLLSKMSSTPINFLSKKIGENDKTYYLKPYMASAEKRQEPRTTRSTRNEHGLDTDDLIQISNKLTTDDTVIGNYTWSQDDLPVSKKLSVSGVRKELETASDKLKLVETAPEIIVQMLMFAVIDYKKLLNEPLKIILAGVHEYIIDLVGSGQLLHDDVIALKSKQGQVAIVNSQEFKEFFYDWIDVSAPLRIKRSYKKINELWIKSIFNLAKCGSIDLDDLTLSKTSLTEELNLLSRWQPKITIIDKTLIIHDPGFRYYVGGLGGKHVYYWDWARNNAERLGRYAGQF